MSLLLCSLAWSGESVWVVLVLVICLLLNINSFSLSHLAIPHRKTQLLLDWICLDKHPISSWMSQKDLNRSTGVTLSCPIAYPNPQQMAFSRLLFLKKFYSDFKVNRTWWTRSSLCMSFIPFTSHPSHLKHQAPEVTCVLHETIGLLPINFPVAPTF